MSKEQHPNTLGNASLGLGIASAAHRPVLLRVEIGIAVAHPGRPTLRRVALITAGIGLLKPRIRQQICLTFNRWRTQDQHKCHREDEEKCSLHV